LERLRERDGGPAIEHGYAATTYQAQGATLDTAFVMADPSMDRQEFYVATSRTRGETYLYATPEIQFERDEFAPRSPYLREGLDHLAEAAERDGAQVSAHDLALRAEFEQLPSGDLVRRLHELRAEAGAEVQNERRHEKVEGEISRDVERLSEIRAEPEGFHPQTEISALERIERARAEREQLHEVGHEARARAAAAEGILAEREGAAATAARISPPDYIKSELGERPSDPAKAAEWDKAVRGIEGYRVRNGVVDRDSALGPKPREFVAEREQDHARRQIEAAQQQLQRARQRSSERAFEMEIGL
jgi:hypothetical protein